MVETCRIALIAEHRKDNAVTNFTATRHRGLTTPFIDWFIDAVEFSQISISALRAR